MELPQQYRVTRRLEISMYAHTHTFEYTLTLNAQIPTIHAQASNMVTAAASDGPPRTRPMKLNSGRSRTSRWEFSMC